MDLAETKDINRSDSCLKSNWLSFPVLKLLAARPFCWESTARDQTHVANCSSDLPTFTWKLFSSGHAGVRS